MGPSFPGRLVRRARDLDVPLRVSLQPIVGDGIGYEVAVAPTVEAGTPRQ